MQTIISFTVEAQAAPQGSKRHVGNGRMIEMSKRVKPYRAAVEIAAVSARLNAGGVMLDGPLRVNLYVYFSRPAAARGRMFPHMGGPGDVDKLIRATFDAITTSGLWVDDARVVDVFAHKRYVEEGDEPSVTIEIRTIAS